MDDMTKQILTTAAGSVVRHAMTTAAGALVTDGLVQAGDSDSFVKIGTGIVMGVGALGLSWWQKSGQAQVTAALKKLTAKNTTTAAVATAQALPTGAAVTKALAIFAVLLASLVFAMPAMAQTTPTKRAPAAQAPSDCLQPVDPRPSCKNGIFAPGGAVDKVAGNPSSDDPDVSCDFRLFLGLTPRNLQAAIKKCVSDVNSTLADDTQRALTSAQNYKPNPDQDAIACLKPGLAIIQAGIQVPAVPAQPEIPANPNATPPTPDIPAVPAQPAQSPGLILLFQKYREFVISGGLSSCQTWITAPVNATINQGINNGAGLTGLAVGAAAIAPIK